jgi:hypothetical protein
VTTAAGMKQVRSMSNLRGSMISGSPNASTTDALGRGRRIANGLRGAMALMTPAIVVLASFAIAH